MSRRDGKLRIAICSAAVGHGHGRAAHALADGLRVLRPDAKVSIIDALSLAPGWFVRGYRDAYLAAIARVPALAGWMYTASDRPQRGLGLGSVLERCAMRRLGTDPLVAQADVVVCTHFLCGRVLSAMRKCGRLPSPLVISVTDQHPHGVWLAPHADLLLVASENARTTAIASGIRPERVRVTGIPIDRRFGTSGPRGEARAMLGLPQDRSIALVSGGGLGLGGMEETVRALLAHPTGNQAVHVVAVCGHNAAIRGALDPLACAPDASEPLKPSCTVLGFTEQMPLLMSAADIMIGKPGGLTTSEATAIGLPMVLIRPIPGQEERNADRLVSAGAAVLERDPRLAGALAARLLGDEPGLARMRDRSAGLGKPDAAETAAMEILELAACAAPAPALEVIVPAAEREESLVAAG